MPRHANHLRRTAAAAVLCAAALAPYSAPAQSATAAPAPDPFEAVNAAARAEYARARAREVAAARPLIILYEGDRVVLLRNGTRAEAKFVPRTDAELKSVGHVPLGTFAALDALGDEPVTLERAGELKTFRDRIAAVRAAVGGRGYAAHTLERQYRILDASAEILDATIASRRGPGAALGAYAHRMAPLVLENVADAARAQLDGLHAKVSAWRRDMTPNEWSAVRVLVVGVHMAREDELATQYFLRLLGEDREGRRVVYAEGLWEEARALDMLGTHVLDGKVGEAFFGDALRMHRDILGDAARAHLDTMGLDRTRNQTER